MPTIDEESRQGLGQDTDASDPSASQLSQGTNAIASAGHETLPVRTGSSRSLPVPPAFKGEVNWPHVMLTLIIAVPVSMLAGAILATVLSWLMR